MNFSEVVHSESGNIVIYNSGGSIFESIPVGDTRVVGSGTSTITINPSGTFVAGNSYYVQVAATAFDDAAGNSYVGISNTTSWNFTTAIPGQTCGGSYFVLSEETSSPYESIDIREQTGG